MSYTEKEKQLCIDLHNRGVRPEIREGDWVIWGMTKEPLLCYSPGFITDCLKEDRDNVILLFSWERAREWLREKGLFNVTLQTNNEISDLSIFSLTKEAMRKFITHGQTDLECALAVMCQVAEGK